MKRVFLARGFLARMFSVRVLGLASAVLVSVAFSAGAQAQGLTASCQAELDKHGGERLKVIERINGFQKRRPTAKQACGTFSELVKVEAEMLKWMEANMDWCRLPEAFVKNFKDGTQQGIKIRAQACTAAKKQAQQPRQPRGPAPGGGVSLPKGAL